MNKIVINGKTLEFDGFGEIRVSNNSNNCVQVNGRNISLDEFEDKNIRIVVHGDVKYLDSSASVEVHGSVGDIDCSGSCIVNGDVKGDVDCSGSVTCGNVGGSVDCSGSIVMRK